MADNGIKAGEAVEVLVSVIMPAWNCAGTFGKAIDILRINISSDMIPLINDQTAFSLLGHLRSKHRTIQSGAHNQVVIWFFRFSKLSSFFFFFLFCNPVLLLFIGIAYKLGRACHPHNTFIEPYRIVAKVFHGLNIV